MSYLFCFIKDNIGFIKDIATTFAAIATTCAAIGAIYGLNTWRRQLVANTECAIVKNVLISLYELREAINFVRTRFQYYPPDLTQDDCSKLGAQQKSRLLISENYQKRLEKIAVAEQKFKTSLVDIEIFWGRQPLEKVEPLLNLIKELNFAISEHCRYTLNQTINLDKNIGEYTQMKTHEKTCFKDFQVDNDEYNEKLENSILNIENVLKPIIQKYHPRKS